MSKKIGVGYIGLGNIGKPSAEHLISNEYLLHVYDVYQPAVDALVAKGAVGCNTVSDVAKHSAHIGICVRDDQQVEALLYGDDGLLAHAAKDTVIAIHSTVTQANLVKWSEQASAQGIHLIDAPITGGAHRAADGTLCYMVGGSAAIVERCKPIFLTSAEKIVHAGAIGAGIALKLCNNFIQYGEFVLMAEASRLAESCGLDVDVLREVGLSNGVVNEQMFMFVSGRNGMVRSGASEQLDSFFGAMGNLARKDLECALATAGDHGVSLPTAQYLSDRIESVFIATDPSRPPQ